MATVQSIRSNIRSFPRPFLGLPPALAQRVSLIRSSPLFFDLPEPALVEIAASAHPRTFSRHELLFVQGQRVVSLILLESGCVKHSQVGPNGSEVLIRFSGKGDIVYIDGETRAGEYSCSGCAMEATRALVWDHDLIESFQMRYPQLENNVTHVLSRQLEELEVRFREMATEKVAKRLSLVLVRLLRQIGKPSKLGIQISVRREDLAQMTGSTMCTVSRLLAGWCERGWMVHARESVIVRDPEQLVSESIATQNRNKSE